jgi:outer membrane protein OmpA-like peptidoglycan-associated protein
MKTIKSLLTIAATVFSIFASQAQTSENPWAIAVGADLINLQGENVDSKLKFGAPALSLSRYIGSGFSIGAQYAMGNSENNGVDLDYRSLDGVLKYNLTEGDILPYLFAGYGMSRFAEDDNKDGIFPSTESGRTISGGIGVNFYLDDNFAINVSTSYRGTTEEDTYNHLQHIIGLSYNFGAGDADKDGVPDEKDTCPDVPGLKEFDGCPDTDGDGIPDNTDRCPEEAGTEALQGCPDRDGDGVADVDDACPDEAGSAAMNGCPDSDGDGVADNVDRCPQEAGDPENAGCPWADRDGDGVPDKDDQCPDEEGSVANNGCPDQPTALIEFINSDQNRFLFSASSSKLSAENRATLESLRALLSQYPNVTITAEGHASSDGSSSYNQKLSEQRAAALKDHLVSIGVDANRIETIGYGETKPIEDNNTVSGRKNNRRVEINRSAQLKIN